MAHDKTIQLYRTATVNNAPTGLAQGELAVEMASSPPKLWCGVPTSIAASGMINLLDGSFEVGTVAPSGPQQGYLWFDTNAPATLKIYNGSAWIAVGGGNGPWLPVNNPAFTGAMTGPSAGIGGAAQTNTPLAISNSAAVNQVPPWHGAISVYGTATNFNTGMYGRPSLLGVAITAAANWPVYIGVTNTGIGTNAASGIEFHGSATILPGSDAPNEYLRIGLTNGGFTGGGNEQPNNAVIIRTTAGNGLTLNTGVWSPIRFWIGPGGAAREVGRFYADATGENRLVLASEGNFMWGYPPSVMIAGYPGGMNYMCGAYWNAAAGSWFASNPSVYSLTMSGDLISFTLDTGKTPGASMLPGGNTAWGFNEVGAFTPFGLMMRFGKGIGIGNAPIPVPYDTAALPISIATDINDYAVVALNNYNAGHLSCAFFNCWNNAGHGIGIGVLGSNFTGAPWRVWCVQNSGQISTSSPGGIQVVNDGKFAKINFWCFAGAGPPVLTLQEQIVNVQAGVYLPDPSELWCDAWMGAEEIGGGTIHAWGEMQCHVIRPSPNLHNQYYWQWNPSNGDWYWHTDNGFLWIMRRPDMMCFNERGPIGSYGYVDFSDVRTKTAIEPERHGLDVIRRLNPIDYDLVDVPDHDVLPPPPERKRKNYQMVGNIQGPPIDSVDPMTKIAPPRKRHRQIGFSAQDVQAALPDAVEAVGITMADGSGGLDSDLPTLGIMPTAILAICVNALKELDRRLGALETKPT